MREGWTYKKLGEVCQHKEHILRAAKLFEPNEKIDYIDISSIDNKQNIILSTTPFVFCEAPSRAQQKVEKGDILISLVRPNLKNIAIILSDDNKLVASSGFCVLRSNTTINNRYIFYIVRGKKFTNYLLARVQGANYPAVREDDIKGYILPVPPLSEQQRIVSELDLLSSIIEKKKAQLKEYDQLAQSIFYDMFGDPVTNEKGWEMKTLGDVATFINGDRGKNYPSQRDFVEYGIPFINAGHLKNGKIDFDSMNYINEDKYNRLNSGKIKDGDILFCLRGSLGKKAFINSSVQGAIASSLVIIRCKNVLNQYLFHYLGSSFISSCIIKSNNGSSQPNLSASSVSSYLVPLPPLSLQQSFASKIEAIERQKALVQQSITETESLFNSRMDYYFD